MRNKLAILILGLTLCWSALAQTGYPLQPNAPRFTVAGVEYAITANTLSGPIVVYNVAIVHFDGLYWRAVRYALSTTDIMAEVTRYGGWSPFLARIKTNLNEALANIFQPAPAGEPTNDDEAMRALQIWVERLLIDTTASPPALK